MSTRMLALREAILALRGGPGDGVEWFGQRAERLGRFRLTLKYPSKEQSHRRRIKRSQTAVGASRAGPRGCAVALAACRALKVGTRRDYRATIKMSAKWI